MPRVNYDRKHLERNSDRLSKPETVHVQRVTDWAHVRAAMVLGMGADTLFIQQDIEKLAITACRAKLYCTDDGKLFAGFKLPEVSIGAPFMFHSSVLTAY